MKYAAAMTVIEASLLSLLPPQIKKKNSTSQIKKFFYTLGANGKNDSRKTLGEQKKEKEQTSEYFN